MILEAERKRAWMLFREGNRLFLNALCSAGPMSYSWTIELNHAELEGYSIKGENFLSWLADDIHNSVPVVRDSDSKYKPRAINDEIREKVEECRAKLREIG